MRRALSALVATVAVAACASPAFEGPSLRGRPAERDNEAERPASAPPDAGAAACPHVGPPLIDVSTFAAADCGRGMRCIPASLVSAETAKKLRACAGGVCAPEKAIAAAGNYVPRRCASLADAEGRCLNENLPQVAPQRGRLPQSGCDPYERCVPCFDPLDGADTGACRTVACDAPRFPATTFARCCPGAGKPSRGRCLPLSLVPDALEKNLGTDHGACLAGKEACVPDELIADPEHEGAPCRGATMITGSYAGVCLSDCLAFGPFESLGISRGDCTIGEVCVPCKNPMDGKPTGAPGCS
jgi:hypothetical protein